MLNFKTEEMGSSGATGPKVTSEQSSKDVCPDASSWIGPKNALSVLVFILQLRLLQIPKSVGNLTPA